MNGNFDLLCVFVFVKTSGRGNFPSQGTKGKFGCVVWAGWLAGSADEDDAHTGLVLVIALYVVPRQ